MNFASMASAAWRLERSRSPVRGFYTLNILQFLRPSCRYSFKKRWFTANFIDLERVRRTNA